MEGKSDFSSTSIRSPMDFINMHLKADFRKHSLTYAIACFQLGFFTYVGYSILDNSDVEIAEFFDERITFGLLYLVLRGCKPLARLFHMQFLFQESY